MNHRIGAEALPIAAVAAGESASGVEGAMRAWRFDGFEFDLRRRELRGPDGAVVALRPKAEALLCQFLAQPGRLLDREALMAALWPATVVTDDSLVQCVGELRTALHDHTHRMILTVPRRGYRWEAAVEPVMGVPAKAALRATRAPGAPVLADQADFLAGSAVPGPPKWRRLTVPAGLLALAIAVVAGASWRPGVQSIDANLAAGRSVTVVPFLDLSHPPAPHLAEGATQQVVTDLGGLQDASVVGSGMTAPPPSVAAVDVKDLGRRLGVRHVLTGAVTRVSERVQIEVQMSRTDTAALEWSERFEYPGVSESNWRTDIARRIAAALDARFLAQAVQTAGQDAGDGTATNEWLLGEYWQRRHSTREQLLEARHHFEAALAADPGSVHALDGLARTYINEVVGRWAPDRQAALTKAKELARRAIAIDPNHSQSLSLLGNAHMFSGEFEDAYPLFRRSLELTPNSAAAQGSMAGYMLFSGHFDQVEAYARAALRLDPLNATAAQRAHAGIGQALMTQGRVDEAIAEFRLARISAPTFPANYFMLAAAEAKRGRIDDAHRELAEALALRPTMTIAKVRATRNSPHPRYIAGLSWMDDGLRLAGLPEGEPAAGAVATR